MRNELNAAIHETATAGPATKSNACLDYETTTHLIRCILDEHGYDDWKIVAAIDRYGQDGYGDQHCANELSNDHVAKEIVISPTYPGIADTLLSPS